MASISSAGIGSGLDVGTIVTKLMDVERAPVDLLKKQASTIQSKISAFGSLQSAVSSFRDAAQSLTKSDTWGATTAASTDAGTVGVSASSSAAAGAYEVRVAQLAKAQTVASATSVASSSALVGEGNLTIEMGTYTPGQAASDDGSISAMEPGFAARATINAMSIPIAATDTLADVRDKINSAGGGVTASIITDSSGARLVLSSSSTGLANAFKVTGTGGGEAFSYDKNDEAGSKMSKKQDALDSKASINGIEVSNSSNTLTDVVQGLTLTLNKVTATSAGDLSTGNPIQVNVSQDKTSIKNSVQGFVTAYNNLASMLRAQTKYDSATDSAGTLQGDSTAVSLQQQLRSALTTPSGASSTFTTLSQVGIEMQSDGTLKMNDSKFTSSLSNLAEVKNFFSSSGVTDSAKTGVAQRLREFGDKVLGSEGTLTTRTAGLNKSLTYNQSQQTSIESRLANTEKRIRAQYTALDTQVAGLTALNTYVSQQITNWNKSTG